MKEHCISYFLVFFLMFLFIPQVLAHDFDLKERTFTNSSDCLVQ